MKKISVCIMAVCLSLAFIPTQVKASPAASATTTMATTSADADALMTRLDEIKTLSKSDLSSTQKKGLRTELRSIRHQLNSLDNGGVYISVGALILIIVLLIILL